MTGGVPAELIDTRQALEKLLAFEFDVLAPGDVRACVPVMNTVLNLANAADARLVAAVDDPYVYVPAGSRSAVAFLRKGSNQHGPAAAARVRRAARLPLMPLVRDAFESGQLTIEHGDHG